MSRRLRLAAVATAIGAAAIAVAVLVRKPDSASRGPTSLSIRITDRATGRPIAGRVLLFDSAGEPVHIGRLDMYTKRQALGACPIAPGVIGSWDGLLIGPGDVVVPVGADDCEPSPAIPRGRYRVWAWRGVEYELWRGEVDLTTGPAALVIPLERIWTPHGALAADLHVHGKGSNDSRVPGTTRVLGQISQGIEVIGLSDHNASGDLDVEIAELGLGSLVTSIASNELTADPAHIGVYPVPVDRSLPTGGSLPDKVIAAMSLDELFAAAHGFAGDPIIQVNHPRFRVTALFDGARWNGVAWPPPFPLAFDAVETLSGHTAFDHGADRRTSDSIRDLYTFIDHGVLVAAVGNSDTHHLNGVHDALARSYVFTTTTPAAFDESAFARAIRARRVVATTGPWLDVEVSTREGDRLTVGSGQALAAADGHVWVDLALAQASFVAADTVRIVVGGPAGPEVARTLAVPRGERQFRWRGRVPVGGADTWLGVDASGSQPLPVELTGTYQIEKGRAGVTPHALINPVLVDGDGDGRWRRGDTDLALPAAGAEVIPPRRAFVPSRPARGGTPPAPPRRP
jgi:hypothetical protein